MMVSKTFSSKRMELTRKRLPVRLKAYIDESGAKGLKRNLNEERDNEFGVVHCIIFFRKLGFLTVLGLSIIEDLAL